MITPRALCTVKESEVHARCDACAACARAERPDRGAKAMRMNSSLGASTPCDGELGDLAKQPKVGDASAERALNTLLGGASA